MQDLLRLARKDKLDDLEGAWTEAVGDGRSADVCSLVRVLDVVASRGNDELAESLLWYLLDAMREAGVVERAVSTARQTADILPDSQLLRDALVDLLPAAPDAPPDAEQIVNTALRDSGLPLSDALRSYDNCVALRPGHYVLDPRHGSVGRVQGFDPEEGSLIVDYGEDGTKPYGIQALGRLDPVPEDDFRALAAFERERLQQLASDDPEELVRLVLSALDRRMQLRRVRLYLGPVVGAWTRWWSRARKVLRRSSIIGMTSGNSPDLFLRSRPMSHGERMLRRFDRATGEERLAMAVGIMREAREHGSPDAEGLRRVARGLAEEPPGLARDAVVAAVARQVPDVAELVAAGDEEVRAALDDPQALARVAAEPSVLACVLEFIRERAPQRWAMAFAELMPWLPQGVCALAAERLAEAGAESELAAAAAEVLAQPGRTHGSLAWLWREVASATGALKGKVDGVAVAVQMLSDAAALIRTRELTEEESHEALVALRTSLFMRDGDALMTALKAARPEQVSTVKALGEHHPGLTDSMRARLVEMLQQVRPDLFERYVPPWAEDCVYTTTAGLEKRRAELEYIVRERLPEVIREVGQAAAFGDLSENAEYTAAVEERGRLAQRAGRLQEEIASARLITADIVTTSHVTVGTRVTVRSQETGQEECFTFLGPWDAQPDDGIYAYNALVGMEFMGAHVGDLVTYQAGTAERSWRILAIDSALGGEDAA